MTTFLGYYSSNHGPIPKKNPCVNNFGKKFVQAHRALTPMNEYNPQNHHIFQINDNIIISRLQITYSTM